MSRDPEFTSEDAFNIVLRRAFEENNERHMTREKLGDATGRIRDLEKHLADANARILALRTENEILAKHKAVGQSLYNVVTALLGNRKMGKTYLCAHLRKAADVAGLTFDEVPF